jgi:hypothetical protein
MSFSSLGLALQVLIALFGAFFLAFWVSLVVWTFRDVRARSRDIFAQLLAVLMVIIFNLFGLILYFLLRPRETLAEKYERALEEEALLQDIEERYNCPGCRQKIRADFQFCPSCHARLKQPCLSCGKLLQLQWGLCPHCGATAAPPTPGLKSAGASRPSSRATTQPVTEHVHTPVEGDTIPLTEVSSANVATPGAHEVEQEKETVSPGSDVPAGAIDQKEDTFEESDRPEIIT